MTSLAEQTRWIDASQLAALVAAGEVTALELLDAAIERIERDDQHLNAVVLRWYDRARAIATGPELPDGPFRGVPFLLKNLNAELAGQPVTNGNVALKDANWVADGDSALVGRYKAAGLVIAGRTNSCEFGSVPTTEPAAYGPTRNPWNTGHIPGGSSGGAAAAVAAGFVPFAHASDGGGSIRIPASCCGVVGLKPSRGRISMSPFRDESGLAVEHCVSRSVRDSAALLDATYGPEIGDTMTAPPPERSFVDAVGNDPPTLRIGVLDHHPVGGFVHDDCVTAVRSASVMLQGLGHTVDGAYPEALSDPDLPKQFMATWSATMGSSRRRLGELLGRELTPDDLEPVNWATAEVATRFSAVDLLAAMNAQMRYRRSIQRWWAQGWDLLVTPTLAEPPLRIGELANDPNDPLAPQARAGRFCPFTPPFNISGQPAVSLPLHWNDDGLPIGVQLVAAYGGEDLLLQVAAQLEAAHPWRDRHPPAR